MRSLRAGVMPFFILIGLSFVIWVYWPGTEGPYLLDDLSNVLPIGDSVDGPDKFLEAVLANNSGPLGRPVTTATFVVESLFFGQAPSVGKIANILLHCLNGLLLGIFLHALLNPIAGGHATLISMVGAAIWLLTPLQVSTVLYQTQRMAILSAFFMLLTCIAYLGFRQRYIRGRGWATPLLVCLVTFGLAMLSKENAYVLLLVIPSLELLFLQQPDGVSAREVVIRRFAWVVLVGVLAISAGGLVVADDWLTSGYQDRSFSMMERLLTQSRVLWDLVFQFFIPDVTRMGLFHDDVRVSTSFLDPPSTLAALFAWFLVIITSAFAALNLEGRRIVAGVVFFLFAHSLESSFLPLELYFEHRNYFPSIGLILILSCMLSAVLRWSRSSAAPLLALAGFYAIYLTFATVSQVKVWSQASLLIANDVAFHPSSPRANMSFAVFLANTGAYPEARQYLRVAEENDNTLTSSVYRLREASLACLANSPMQSTVITGLAPDESLATDEAEAAILSIIDRMQSGACPRFQAELFANRLTEILDAAQLSARQRFRVSMLGASLENALGRYRQAMSYSNRALELQPDHVPALLMNLYFALILDEEGDAQAARQKLNVLEETGKLNAEQQSAFSTYRKRQHP